jgi:hypothetical protein
MAVGGIAYGMSDSYEISVIALLLINFIFPMIRGKSEPFMNTPTTPQQISDRITMTRKHPNRKDVSGVSSFMSEGFQDADQKDMTVDPEKSVKKVAGGEVSAPAPVAEPEAEAEAEPAPEPAPPKKISEQGIPPVQQPQETETFQDNGGLFKLGQIPKDVKGGFHIDTGTTVINALKALKPDQINAMTQDTKQLIETQKSLMNMLQTFKPMMSEGKEMMNTFQSMFSPAMGATQTATDMLQGKAGL